MKLTQGFVLREIAGESMLIPVGEQTMITGGRVSLSSSGALIWKALSEKPEYEYALQKMLDKYEISEETARRDPDDFVHQMKEKGLIRE